MKNKRIIKILIFVIIVLLISINRSYAAIEIKDTTAAVFTNKTISEFYDMAEEMKNPGQGLEGSNVDVKMANNYEWAIVSYFSNSIYGTAGAGQNTGVQLTDSTHLSTNGNITGVMDWGKTVSFTAGIIKSWKNNDGTIRITKDTVLENGSSIINAADSNRVDKFTPAGIASENFSIAKVKWYTVPWSFANAGADTPFMVRTGLFGLIGGGSDGSHGEYLWADGAKRNNITFRPVFYAQ